MLFTTELMLQDSFDLEIATPIGSLLLYPAST